MRSINLVDAKGDILTHDGIETSILNVGADGDILIANSLDSNGIEWTSQNLICPLQICDDDDDTHVTTDFNGGDSDIVGVKVDVSTPNTGSSLFFP